MVFITSFPPNAYAWVAGGAMVPLALRNEMSSCSQRREAVLLVGFFLVLRCFEVVFLFLMLILIL